MPLYRCGVEMKIFFGNYERCSRGLMEDDIALCVCVCVCVWVGVCVCVWVGGLPLMVSQG